MVYNSIWRGIHTWPYQGKEIDWENLRVFEVGSRWLVEVFFWTEIDPLVDTQSLVWMIFEFKEKNGITIIEQLKKKVRIRKKLANGKHLYDKWSSYSLNQKPSGQLEATVNGSKKLF